MRVLFPTLHESVEALVNRLTSQKQCQVQRSGDRNTILYRLLLGLKKKKNPAVAVKLAMVERGVPLGHFSVFKNNQKQTKGQGAGSQSHVL